MTDRAGVDEFDEIVEMVDQPSYTAPQWLRTRVLSEQRLPILAPWAKDIDEFKRTATWLWLHYRHTWAYHLARTPLYLLRVLARGPRGLARTVTAAVRWCLDEPTRYALSLVNENREPERYAKLDEIHRDHVHKRSALVGSVAVTIAVAPFALAAAPAAYQAIVLVAVVGVLAKIGEEHDKPIVSRAVVATKAERLTADTVERALWKLSKIKEGDPIRFPSPITRDGAGWRADVDLPEGVTAAEVVEQRDKLAAALRRPQGAVWPEPAPDVHPGRLVLWVGDEDMSTRQPPRWPLAKKGDVNVFDPIPFGIDFRGRVITITLMFASMVVGSIPRMGKTWSVRLLLLAAALDVRCELHVYDLKGTGDFSAFQPVAHRYRAGDDDDDLAYALTDMRDLRSEFRRRAKVIRELPANVCPENKVTDDLASRRSLRLHPIVLGIDECHLWYQHPVHGDEFEEIVSDLSKRGPAVGIFAVNATQEPKADTLPPSISRNAVLRFCLKVMDQVPNDAVLGTSAYKTGVRATLFKRSDVGIGLLAGEGDAPTVVQTYPVDGPQAEAIVERARVLRAEGGWLTGDAAGDTLHADTDRRQFLIDVLSVVPSDEDKVWSSDLCDRLADLNPAAYGDLEQNGDKAANEERRRRLASRLADFDVDTKQLRIGDGVQAGVRREWVAAALDAAS